MCMHLQCAACTETVGLARTSMTQQLPGRHAAGNHPVLGQDRTRSTCFSEGVTFLHWNLCQTMICYKLSGLLKVCSTFPWLQPEVPQAKNIWICPIELVLLYFLSLPEGLIPLVPHCQKATKLLHPIKWTLHNKQSFSVHLHCGTFCQALIHIKNAPHLNVSLERIMRWKVLIKACIWI